MTLEKTLRQQLGDAEPGGFHLTSHGWNITLVTDRSDSLSHSLNELALESAAPHPLELKPWAEGIAQRVTGLLEPLSLIEVDAPLGQALLRSQAPSQRDGKTFYYELVLERTTRSSARLRRYTGDRHHGERRDAVPFVLTHDAIVKLVTDIVGSP